MNTKFRVEFSSQVITIHFFKQIPKLAEIFSQLAYETVPSALLIPYNILFYGSSCFCFIDLF